VIDNCRDIISHGASEEELQEKGFKEERIELLNMLKMKAVRLLLSLIEGSFELDIIMHITQSLDDFSAIMARLHYVYEAFVTGALKLNLTASLSTVNAALKKDSFDGAVIEGFDIFILVNQLADCSPVAA